MRHLLMILLFVPLSLWGQMNERFSLRMNYIHHILIGDFDKMSTNEFDVHYPFQIPTFLGNYKSSGLELAFKFKSENNPFSFDLIFRKNTMKFTGGYYYKNLECAILAPGLGVSYQFPVTENFSLAGFINILTGISSISRDENRLKIYYGDVVYKIIHEELSERFFLPSLEPGLEFEYLISSNLAFQTRCSLLLSSFPDFETTSPLFHKSLQLSAGVKLVINRKKTIGY